MKKTFVLSVLCCAVYGAWAGSHSLEIEGPVMVAEEGLLLGNGDLSVSVYQTADEIVFRLGKGDVWDRRLDFTDVPKPATIQEYRNGVLREGWKCNPFDGKGTVATKGTKDEKRMREICQGVSNALRKYPCPCPKPTGEVKLRYPADMPGLAKIRQRLDIERGLYTIEMSWKNGVRLEAEAVVDPDVNVLSLAWKVTGWTEDVRIGRLKYPDSPVRVSVVREQDPDPISWSVRHEYASGHPAISRNATTAEMKTLPAPVAYYADKAKEGRIEQSFYPDNLFPKGFIYRITLDQIGSSVGKISRANGHPACKDACVVLTPYGTNTAGEVAVFVTTSRDKTLDAPETLPHAAYRAAAERSGAEYWRKSRLTIPDDRELEDLWYATYHARRCILRPGTVPPGLFFPSTLDHYSHWHGDYHSNYNFHSIYWGDFTANRLDQAETYFDCCDFYVPVGRKIARDYYGGRGVFFMLEGFPLLADDDFNGQLPLGRMAYMTGWTSSRYLEYWQYARDRDWLAKRGYPMLKDCALFYLDFLLKAPNPDLPPNLKDGKYHAFPSIQGESAIPGDPMALCDKSQVMMHARHALYAAIVASKALNADAELRAQWQERLDNLNEPEIARLKGYERHCFLCAPPEFVRRSLPYAPRKWDGKTVNGRDGEGYWYFGHSMRWRIGYMRDNGFVYGRHWPEYRESLRRWEHANGLVWGMSLQKYGRSGGWTETLSCMAPLQEMLLQSWDGAIRLFPWWPKERPVAFENWRAQGAFLVDAACEGGRVTRFIVRSEKGEDCLVHGEWTVSEVRGVREVEVEKVGGQRNWSSLEEENIHCPPPPLFSTFSNSSLVTRHSVATDHDEFGRLRFKTVPGGVYELRNDVTVAQLPKDGKTNIHDQLQRLIDERSAAGGGVVVLPAGTYDTTGFLLKDNVTLHLEEGARLVADSDWKSYPVIRLAHSEVEGGVWRALVGAMEAKNVAVAGTGTIDMRGATCSAKGHDRPRGLLFRCSTNVTVTGVHLVNGASWMCYFKECEGVIARGVKIYSHQNSNNDGFDIEASNVLIEDCVIDSGDDGVCLKSDNPDFAMTNVVVRNCTVASTCCAYKLGTASNGPCRDIRIVDCKAVPCVFMDEATCRLTIMKGAPGVTDEHTGITGVAIENVDGGVVEGVCVSNVSIHGYSTPMFVRLGSRKPNRMKSGERTALRNIAFHNVDAEATSRIASSVTGVPGLRPENVLFRHVRLGLLSGGTEADANAAVPEKVEKYPESYMFDRLPLPGYAFYVRHADDVHFEDVATSFLDAGTDARKPIYCDDATCVRMP